MPKNSNLKYYMYINIIDKAHNIKIKDTHLSVLTAYNPFTVQKK